MKLHIIYTGILLSLLTATISAQTSAGKYITRKSTYVSSRNMNNVVVTMEADGIKFVIPPGSINPSLEVAVYNEQGTLIVKSGTPGDKIARLAVQTQKFDGAVEVHIPIANTNKLPVAYAVDKSDAWEPLTFKGLSPDRTTAIFVTNKPLTVAWVTPE